MLRRPKTIGLAAALAVTGMTTGALAGDCQPVFLFGPQQVTATNPNPGAPATGDINGDGNLDVVIPNLNTNDVSIMLGNGDGTFSAPVTKSYGANVLKVMLFDMNGTGDLDLVALVAWGEVRISFGEGDGTFGFEQSIPFTGTPYDMQVGDLDSDGDGDVAVLYESTPGSRIIGAWARSGSSYFGGPFRTTPGSSDRLAVLDADGDLFIDFVVNEPDEERLRLYWGAMSGNQILLSLSEVSEMLVTDFDNNGWDDIIAVWPGGVSVILGLEGIFGAGVLAPGFGEHTSVTVADFDRDGFNDVAAGTTGKTFTLWLGDGTANLGIGGPYNAGDVARNIVAGDLDGNTMIDVVVTNGQILGGVTARLNACSPPEPVCSGDVNDDLNVDFGDLLLVLANWTCGGECAGDANQDGVVSLDDLLIVLSSWGPCDA